MEPGVQGVQLYTHFFGSLLWWRPQKVWINITSLHTHILEASTVPAKCLYLTFLRNIGTSSSTTPEISVFQPSDFKENLTNMRRRDYWVTQPLLFIMHLLKSLWILILGFTLWSRPLEGCEKKAELFRFVRLGSAFLFAKFFWRKAWLVRLFFLP